MLDESLDSAFVDKHLFALVTFIAQQDAHAGVKEREFPQSVRQGVELEFDVREDGRTGQKTNRRTGLVRVPEILQRSLRDPHVIDLLVITAATRNTESQRVGKRIDHGDADPVQTAGDLVGVVVELAACMQRGHDDLGSGVPLLMHIHRDSAPVVAHRGPAITVQGHHDFMAIAGQGLVDGVIHHLVNHMMQPGSVIGVTDVHSRTFSNCI